MFKTIGLLNNRYINIKYHIYHRKTSYILKLSNLSTRTIFNIWNVLNSVLGYLNFYNQSWGIFSVISTVIQISRKWWMTNKVLPLVNYCTGPILFGLSPPPHNPLPTKLFWISSAVSTRTMASWTCIANEN